MPECLFVSGDFRLDFAFFPLPSAANDMLSD
jgi:hypothetical protein